MARLIALLRAVNVGGTGKLPMANLKVMCRDAGFTNVATYLASGNAVFTTDLAPKAAEAALVERLRVYAGRPVGVLVRTAAEMAAILDAAPFADADPARAVVIFLPGPPPPDVVAGAAGRTDEAIVAGRCELYVHYPSGQGRSKLRLPGTAAGTARNMNTVAALARLARAPSGDLPST
jgi:uncharacterized protein (DUF1697 family)